MNSNFKINLDVKRTIHNNYRKTKKGYMILSYGLIGITILFTVIFLIYGLGLESTFIVEDSTSYQYGEKDMALIFCILAAVDVVLLFLWAIQKLVVKRITGIFLSERVNESLILEDGYLEYGYQNFAGASACDRVVIKIPVKDIRTVVYEEKIKRIQIRGQMCQRYYDDYLKRETRASEEYKEDVFTTFDYYEPSLLRFLQKDLKVNVEVR